MGGLDCQRVKQGRQVGGVEFHRVRAIGVVRLALAAAVVLQNAIMASEGGRLVDSGDGGAHDDAVVEHQHRRAGQPMKFIIKCNTVGFYSWHYFAWSASCLACKE